MADKAVSSLQDDDLEVLMKLARDKTVAGRKALVNAVSDLFFNNQEVLSDRERALMTDILRQIIHDVEMSVRRELAGRLADIHHAPRDLILTLANDDIEVAHRVLVQSDILHDMDLVEIIHHRTMEHQLVIAMRKNLNETVTDALVETGNEDVIKAMLDNTSARISKGTMEYLVDQSKPVDTYQNPLLKRPDLEPDLAKRMYWWVSAALRQHIIKNFNIDPADLDETLEDSVKSVIDNHGRAVEQPKHVELVERLHEEGKVTPRMLLQVLRQGEVPLFEAMFGKLSGLRPCLLRRMMFEPGGEALAIVCRAIGIDKADFASIFMLTRKARAHERVMNPRELSRVLELYDRVTPEVAQRMLKKWQRDTSFLNAIRALEASDSSKDGKRFHGDRRRPYPARRALGRQHVARSGLARRDPRRPDASGGRRRLAVTRRGARPACRRPADVCRRPRRQAHLRQQRLSAPVGVARAQERRRRQLGRAFRARRDRLRRDRGGRCGHPRRRHRDRRRHRLLQLSALPDSRRRRPGRRRRRHLSERDARSPSLARNAGSARAVPGHFPPRFRLDLGNRRRFRLLLRLAARDGGAETASASFHRHQPARNRRTQSVERGIAGLAPDARRALAVPRCDVSASRRQCRTATLPAQRPAGVRRQDRHLLGIINDILDISKADAGKLQLYEEEVDLRQEVQDAMRLFNEHAADVGLKLKTDLPETPPPLWADRRKIKQVLLNLLSNAIKFTPPGGEVRVSSDVDPANGDLRLMVSDSGIGIAQKDIEKVFSAFGQVESSLSRRYEGTGLGLPLSVALIELHGGKLELESTVGIGTKITVRLPARRLHHGDGIGDDA